MKKVSGRAFLKGISLKEFINTYSTEAKAEQWFIRKGMPDGGRCPNCGFANDQTGYEHPTMSFQCTEKACSHPRFGTKTGRGMEGSKLGNQEWITTLSLLSSSLESVSRMKFHRDLDVTQKSAWFLAHRLRGGLSQTSMGCDTLFAGPVEVDESCFGGKRRNMSNAKRKELDGTGRGAVGKTTVVGAQDRATNQVSAKVVASTDADTLQGFGADQDDPKAKVYTDDAKTYDLLPFNHETVKHSLQEYVKGDVHTNGIESLWSMKKRAHKRTFHKLSPKHLDRYVQEYAGRHNVRDLYTIEQMQSMRGGMEGKRLTYKALIANYGLASGARA